MAYKSTPREATVQNVVSDAFALFDELGEEMSNWFDNMPESLQQGDRGQTVADTAQALDGLSEPEIPDCVKGLTVKYTEQVQTDKRRGPSRTVRHQNAVSMLEAANQALYDFAGATDNADDRQVATDLAASIEDELSGVDGLEFPSAFG